MADKRYIDADKLTFSRVRIIHSDGTIGGWHAVVMSSVIKDAPAADVVSLDDVREAFQAYILEMTCSKYGTPQETQFARDIVRQAVNIVLGERKE